MLGADLWNRGGECCGSVTPPACLRGRGGLRVRGKLKCLLAFALLGFFAMETPIFAAQLSEELQGGGQNAPITTVNSIESFEPDSALGASRYRHTLDNGAHFDALLVNKRADVLVVSFHGATDREKNTLPRFERLRSFLGHDVSSMYFADPALWINHKNYFQLAWFTGWEGFDAQRVAAEWALKAARAIGATRILFTGASGGGFVALQVSALIPGSVALSFNPQTSIYGYLALGYAWGAQKNYRNVVWPEQIGRASCRERVF